MTINSEEREFEGVYEAHWELSCFVVQTTQGSPGRPQIEQWLAWFPDGFTFPDEDTLDLRVGRSYKMRVRGRLGPRGHFGHLGVCERELFVTEVLVCVETSPPEDIWATPV